MDWATIIYYVSGFLIFVVIIIALVAQSSVQSAYSKYSQMPSSLNLTGGQLAEKLCAQNNMLLQINTVGGSLSDHYNSKDKSLNISQANYNSSSVAALAVVAHEFGHALQDEQGYAPLKIRQIAVKVSNAASRFFSVCVPEYFVVFATGSISSRLSPLALHFGHTGSTPSATSKTNPQTLHLYFFIFLSPLYLFIASADRFKICCAVFT